MTSALSELFKHNLWANLRLLDVCARLDQVQLDATVPGTYGSIHDTLIHLITAEGRYVALLSDRQPDQRFNERTGFPGWEELRAGTAEWRGADRDCGGLRCLAGAAWYPWRGGVCDPGGGADGPGDQPRHRASRPDRHHPHAAGR